MGDARKSASLMPSQGILAAGPMGNLTPSLIPNPPPDELRRLPVVLRATPDLRDRRQEIVKVIAAHQDTLSAVTMDRRVGAITATP